jgi:hypothetical protein
MMTRQHFKLIAEAIRTFEPPFAEANQTESEDKEQTQDTRLALAEHFAQELRNTNGNFDRRRFIEAATKDG